MADARDEPRTPTSEKALPKCQAAIVYFCSRNKKRERSFGILSSLTLVQTTPEILSLLQDLSNHTNPEANPNATMDDESEPMQLVPTDDSSTEYESLFSDVESLGSTSEEAPDSEEDCHSKDFHCRDDFGSKNYADTDDENRSEDERNPYEVNRMEFYMENVSEHETNFEGDCGSPGDGSSEDESSDDESSDDEDADDEGADDESSDEEDSDSDNDSSERDELSSLPPNKVYDTTFFLQCIARLAFLTTLASPVYVAIITSHSFIARAVGEYTAASRRTPAAIAIDAIGVNNVAFAWLFLLLIVWRIMEPRKD